MAVAILALQVANEFLHIVDVVVQMEFTVGQGNQAGIFPVGDVDLVAGQHCFDRVAQQGGIVARQGRHDQHHGLFFELVQGGSIVAETLEAAQLTKRLVDLHTLVDGHIHTVHRHRLDAKGRFLVIFAKSVDQVIGGRNTM